MHHRRDTGTGDGMGVVLLNMSVSLDGFCAGPQVGAEHPMGIGGSRLHDWLFAAGAEEQPTRSGTDRAVTSDGTTPTGVDTRISAEIGAGTGAVLIGRRTFDVGVGLWGDTPFPVPTFVLTSRAHEPMPMASATFTFVTDGVGEAVRQARAAAGDRNVLVMGGAGVAQACLRAGLVDEIQLQVVPVLLGSGVRLFDRHATGPVELIRVRLVESPAVTHLRYRVRR
jgi:dihydrofolate reductase